MEWSAPDGSLHAASFDDPLSAARANQRLRAALSPDGEWLPEVIHAAHKRLEHLRELQPDAGGLVIATDQEHAYEIANLIRTQIGVATVVATSDDPTASKAIQDFRARETPWLVAVRMVSEGVDIPRLRVGVYATTTTTELFFRQAVGRFVRWQPGVRRQSAHLFIPDDPRLRTIASEIAEDRRHSLKKRNSSTGEQFADESLVDLDAPAMTGDLRQLSMFSMISAVATTAVIPDDDIDEEHAGEEEDPTLVFELPMLEPLPGDASGRDRPGVIRVEHKGDLRRENARLVSALAQITGMTHAQVNGELNRIVGLRRVTEATVAQLETRRRRAESWLERL
jgi:superfamily II DNA or RNA helicase